MGRLSDRLAPFPELGLDTVIFIYHLECHPRYLSLTQELFQGVENGRWEAITSVITLMEINVRPLQMERQDIARKYEALLVNFPHLKIVSLDREVVRHAAQIRASLHIRPADALQVAACLVHGGKAFVTNDRQLTRLQKMLEVIILDDYC